ncbi:MAG: phosphonate ABC transporter, permease protein PhnE [Planctomycetota bacterium]
MAAAASTTSTSALPVWQLRTPRETLAAWFTWLIILALGATALGWIVASAPWQQIGGPLRILDQVYDLTWRALPPDWSHSGALLWPLWQTINIATLGTCLALLVALPVSLCAARTTTPFAAARWIALAIIAASRSVNSLIWALLLVKFVGPGELAGVFAIALRSIGFLGKLMYEAIEEANPLPVEAVRATGGGPMQVVAWGIWPQVQPAFWGVTLLRWDINIRESMIVGIVGAGGLGLTLRDAMMLLRWDRVSLILLVILVLVALGEFLSARIRRRLV